MRTIFAGTPSAAVPTLLALLASHHEVVAALTRPPARSGRGRTLHPSAVAEVASSHGVPLIEAVGLRDESVRARIGQAGADLGVVVAYGALIPPDVLGMPRLGWANLHFSDLPHWRGAAPVQWAVREGDPVTASCVFQLEEGLDTGPVYSRLPVEIGHESAGELLARMADLGARQVVEVADALEDGTAQATPQGVEGAGPLHYARRLTTADGLVDFRRAAGEVDRVVRSVTPDPGAWTTLPDGRRLGLGTVTPTGTPSPGPGVLLASRRRVEVGCADTTVLLGEVAPAGRSWMDAAAWARGARLGEGTRLGVPAQDADTATAGERSRATDPAAAGGTGTRAVPTDGHEGDE
ncbi:methionyl-tRNA formyltransferase [Actinomyces polynesiensis]|uniref:methionyl-tRNA formyltransferase n=1 Tax=Actinomyces polynesiensis TaxID=1325934 RepID=UPI000939F442|nr:methionyl-tRNA formyltransferase [Actinomyces polynesiensis]